MRAVLFIIDFFALVPVAVPLNFAAIRRFFEPRMVNLSRILRDLTGVGQASAPALRFFPSNIEYQQAMTGMDFVNIGPDRPDLSW